VYCGGVEPGKVYQLAQKKTGLGAAGLFGVFVGLLTFILVGCICFYRGFMKVYGYRPFDPPNICPNIFFPRELHVMPESVAQELVDHRQNRGDYEPPRNV